MSEFEILNETIEKERSVINAAHERIRELERKRDERVLALYDAVNCENEYAKLWNDVSEHRKNDWRIGLKALDAYDEAKRQTQVQESTGSLRGDLARVLNYHSMENRSNTPDFLLANFLTESLFSADRLINRREGWYDVKMEPGAKWERTNDEVTAPSEEEDDEGFPDEEGPFL